MKIVIANLKMNILSPVERERYLEMFKKELAGKILNNTQIVLCPPAVHIEAFGQVKNEKACPVKSPTEGRGAATPQFNRVKIGAQNIFWERSGAFTGEISASMVKNLGADFVILGHSERRKFFGEKNEEVNLKIIAALKNGLTPILCVGESKGQQAMGASVIKKQLEECLAGIARAKIESIIFCYEPVWAISSNNPDHLPTADEIMSARLLLKKILVGKFGPKITARAKFIYGGSVSTANAKEVCLESGMDGVLVGKESLAPYELIKIAEIVNNG
jgi:triosephosphate isomerase